MKTSAYFKIIFLLIASIYFIYCAIFPNYHFLDTVDLAIHESGHLIFMVFGGTIYMLGGTIFQLLVPLLFTIYFLKRNEPYSSSFVMFWLGQSLINISVYMKDAQTMQLPLFGGGIHDWNYIFTQYNLLPLTQPLGSAVYALGFITIIFAIIFGFYSVFRESKSQSSLDRIA